jgi:calnexin
LLVLALAVSSSYAETDDSETVVFYESFDTSWDGRWVVSESSEYKGTWKYEQSAGHEDFGLLASEKAKKYGIAVDVPKTVEFKDNTVVLQYDLRLQEGLECGGAYLKFLLPQEAGWTPSQFDNTAPYSIMFGPDKCGSTNKVHFIFRHKSPKTGEYVEHHLKSPPTPVNDKLSHVYTAVISPDNTVKILVDGEEKKTAELLGSDFEPPVIPSKTIPDPDDKKPEDWDERAKIPDPEATKPEDWDEEAPREILDEEAEKPEGWLDDEPDEVDDPEAEKPEDWDEEEDGEWEAPKVPNPKCEEAPGCGEWVRPTIKNPAYKGKWHAPMIDNPAYKGIWKPREIDNPDYFELEKVNIEPIGAIGIEIWTMQDGILFDNILVTNDEAEAAAYRETTWKAKFDVEKAEQEKEEKVADPEEDSLKVINKKVFEVLYRIPEVPLLAPYKSEILALLEKAEEHPTLTVGGIFGTIAIILGILLSLVFGRKKAPAPVPAAKKDD